MEEIWLPVPIKEYSKDYRVSNYGRVLSLNYRRTGRSEVLKPFDNGDGYLFVELWKNRKEKRFYVHRLVAEAFLPNLLDYPEVNHIDENMTNNFVGTPDKDFVDGNLEWCDHKENCNHGTRNKRIAEKQSKPVLQLSLTGELIKEWPSVMEVGRNGFHSGHVSLCCCGKQKTHHGFRWKYKEP